MSKFFESELIQEELKNINKLQEEIYEKIYSFWYEWTVKQN